MEKPWFLVPVVPISGSVVSPGDIAFVRARTVSVTVRCTFDSSGDTDATVYVYYSPDGSHWDTIAFTSFTLTVSAGNEVQRTVNIDFPEHGYGKIKVMNGDATYTITKVMAWYTVQSWQPWRGLERGSLEADWPKLKPSPNKK